MLKILSTIFGAFFLIIMIVGILYPYLPTLFPDYCQEIDCATIIITELLKSWLPLALGIGVFLVWPLLEKRREEREKKGIITPPDKPTLPNIVKPKLKFDMTGSGPPISLEKPGTQENRKAWGKVIIYSLIITVIADVALIIFILSTAQTDLSRDLILVYNGGLIGNFIIYLIAIAPPVFAIVLILTFAKNLVISRLKK